jgi:DNA adenine methylase
MIPYFGGKLRIGQVIVQEILEFIRTEVPPEVSQGIRKFLDCFVGVGGVLLPMTAALAGTSITPMGSDIDPHLMRLWDEVVQKGWEIPPLTRKEFESLKETRQVRSPLHLVVGHSTGFQRKYFSRNWKSGRDGEMQGYLASARKRLVRAQEMLADKKIILQTRDYRDYTKTLMEESPAFSVIVYADPPYRELVTRSNLTRHFTEFDSKEFWNTMRVWSSRQFVFVSEYSAPPDFVEIWSSKRTNHTCTGASKLVSYTRVEKLFIHKDLTTKEKRK